MNKTVNTLFLFIPLLFSCAAGGTTNNNSNGDDASLTGNVNKEEAEVSLSEKIDWIKDVNVASVKEVRVENYYIGSNPGTFVKTTFSKNEEDIKRAVAALDCNISTIPSERMYGGSGVKLIIITDTNTYEIAKENERISIDGQWYRTDLFIETALKNPYLDGADSFYHPYMTVLSPEITTASGTSVTADIDLSTLSFVESKESIGTEYKFIADCSKLDMPNLYVYDATTFTYNDQAYTVVSESNFSKLFN